LHSVAASNRLLSWAFQSGIIKMVGKYRLPTAENQDGDAVSEYTAEHRSRRYITNEV
jgi:hypothetical protein